MHRTLTFETDDEVGDRKACSPTTAKSVEMCAAKVHKYHVLRQLVEATA